MLGAIVDGPSTFITLICSNLATVNIFFLLTDGFGGHGGIAKVNRDVCRALSSAPLQAEIQAYPLITPAEKIGSIPERVVYHTPASGSRIQYIWNVFRSALCPKSSFDVVLCGHINLLPVAALVAKWRQVPLWLMTHGVDAWTPHPSVFVRAALPYVDLFTAVSQYTKNQFLAWAPLQHEQGHVIPNSIDPDSYGVGPKSEQLLSRYNLHERTVLLTLSRLSANEQYKGHDQVLEVLPSLAKQIPDIAYLICGDGDDRTRLQKKSQELDIADRVVFAGYVPEEEKAAHYRLADAFVMPGRGEGFGIVYLEALASGVPVVASEADASREAVLGGQMGAVVDPDSPEDIKRGIQEALQEPRVIPKQLEYFSFERFQERWQQLFISQFTTDQSCFSTP